MENASNFSEDSLPSFLSLSELSFLHDQLADWATLKKSRLDIYTPIINLSSGSSEKMKKMYEKKREKKFVVLKEFLIQKNLEEQKHFVKELFMGMFMRRNELLTWSDFFFYKNVRTYHFFDRFFQILKIYKANLNNIPI